MDTTKTKATMASAHAIADQCLRDGGRGLGRLFKKLEDDEQRARTSG